MLRFIAAAFLFLCFAVHTVSATEMTDAAFEKQIKGINGEELDYEKLSKGRTLLGFIRGNPEKLKILRETLLPTFQKKIRYVKKDWFSDTLKNALALREEIDKFYDTEAGPLQTELAEKFKPLLAEVSYHGDKIDVLANVKERKGQVAQLEGTAGSNELQTIAVRAFIPSIGGILEALQHYGFGDQLKAALKIKKEVQNLVVRTSVAEAELHNAVAAKFEPLLETDIESELKKAELKKAETLQAKGAVFTAMKDGVEQLCQNVTTKVLQDTWAGQIETFLNEQVAIIKWHENRDAELAELRQLAEKLEGTEPRFVAQLAPDDILAITDPEVEKRVKDIKQKGDSGFSMKEAYDLAIEASQAIGNNPGQQNQLRKAVKEIVTKNQGHLKYISDGHSNGKYVSAFDAKFDSALRIRNVIDVLYQGKEQTELQDALVTAFKPLVKDGLSFYGSEFFEVRLGKILKLKRQLLPLESEGDPTALRLAALEAFKYSVEEMVKMERYQGTFSKASQAILNIKNGVKQVEEGLNTTELQDVVAQNFGDVLSSHVSKLWDKNLTEAEKIMPGMKVAVPQIQTEVSDAAARALQNAWNEAGKSFFYKKMENLRDREKQEQLGLLKALAEKLDADTDQPVFTTLFAPSEKYNGDILKIEEEVFEKKIKETVNSRWAYKTILDETSKLKNDLEGKKSLQGALLEAFAKGPLKKEVKEIVTGHGDLMPKIQSLYQLKSAMIGMNIDKLAEGTDSTVLQETFANEIKPLLENHQIKFTSPENVRAVMGDEYKLLSGIKLLGLEKEYMEIVTRAVQTLFDKGMPYGQNKWEYQGKLRDAVLFLLDKNGYLKDFDTKTLEDAVVQHYRAFFGKQKIEQGDLAGQGFMRGLAGDLDHVMESQEFETLLQQQQEAKKEAPPAAKAAAIKVEEPVFTAPEKPVHVAPPSHQTTASASAFASFVKEPEPVKPVIKDVSLNLKRHPVHDKTWGTDPFKVLNDIMYKKPDELLEVNWNDSKFQGNPVRAVAMIALFRMNTLLDREFTKDLVNEKIKTLTDVASKTGKTDFFEKYPNKPSQILAMSALLNPPGDDAHTWLFTSKRPAEILSTGWLWGFDYKKKTSKEELRALYDTAWNTGIRQFYFSRGDIYEIPEKLAEKLIKKPSQEPSGADRDRLMIHQAIAFTIAAKAAAETSTSLKRSDINDAEIMGTLNDQLTKVWGKTITKQALANKLETLEDRMR